MNHSETLHHFKSEIKINYKIKFTSSLYSLHRNEFSLGSEFQSNRRLIVIDHKVNTLFGSQLNDFFISIGIDPIFLPIECSEGNKNHPTVLNIIDQMDGLKLLRRAEPVIAIGGGILLDIVGFAVSIYRRGTPYIRIPTTLVGMIDAAVGLKTAINYNNKRNRLGAYFFPIRCIIDPIFLSTLTRDQIRDGLSEILKLAIILDAELFEMMELYGRKMLEYTFLSGNSGYSLIKRSIIQISKQIESNPTEEILDRFPDFGHTFSPSIEFHSLEYDNSPLSHGQAVILDIYFSCIIAKNRGILSERLFIQISNLLDVLGLRKHHPLFLNENMVKKALTEINIHRNNNSKILLPTTIGGGEFYPDLTIDEIRNAIQYMKRENS